MSTAFSKAVVDDLNRSTPTCPKSSSSPCRPAGRPAAPHPSPTHSAPGLPATISFFKSCGNPVFGFLPARNGLMNTDRLTESQQDCRQLFQKLSMAISRSTPTCPKSSSPCRPAKSRPRRIASPTHSAPGLPATIISLRQSRVWVPACSQWLDEHRSTSRNRIVDDSFSKAVDAL